MLTPVERPLHAKLLMEVESLVDYSSTELTWISKDFKSRVQSLASQMQRLHQRVLGVKQCRETIQSIAAEWSSTALIQRAAPDKPMPLAEAAAALVRGHCERVESQARGVRSLVVEARHLTGMSEDAQEWESFVAFCSRELLRGLAGMVACSLDYLVGDACTKARASEFTKTK